ncbi:LamG-like jellyroll fold domain-containing protein [Pontibacter burrus]|uniref:PKD domain-containing protein n=1 Tax=Pontibacter burrus TaxID=2704466 RepID=A0A6B3LQN2_9BACT|nr:LamG-like jellyroll fold domain-containing protein [Pontibacter burrus]NEM99182.1 PKD domain-containing protein [Pontibacter burrus]
MNKFYPSYTKPDIQYYNYSNYTSQPASGAFKAAFLAVITFVLTCIFTPFTAFAQSGAGLPDGFIEEQIGGEWNMVVGLKFSKDGKRMYVWEKAGKVWIVENGERKPEPLIDISEEVGDWGDHGLLGFEIDPNFESNGYIYLLYVVDRHHLFHHGKSSYNPVTNDYRDATIGRLTRYTAGGSNKTIADPASRKILIGHNHTNGIPVLFESHGVGSLVFGADGSLLVSTGDGASGGGLDYGYIENDPFEHAVKDTYSKQALEDGIIKQKENIGAYKSQQLESYNGKILRIDPATGRGVQSNPFYDAKNPDAPISKVWALGFRNPFRFSVKPGTGSATQPGVLYISDTGWTSYEEINVATGPAMNFGWPMYEGLEQMVYYMTYDMSNTSAPNPLHGKNGCEQKFFTYQDLLQAPKRTQKPYFGNFCDWNQAIPDNVPKFVHARPVLEWGNGSGGARVGVFEGEDAATAMLGDAKSGVQGPQFYGSSATGGVWYTGTDFPAEYRNSYFFGDYGAGWIKLATFDSEHRLKSVRKFKDNDAIVVDFAVNPATGNLYYINYASKVMRVSYTDGNYPPEAVAKADKLYGTSPLTVKFTGSESKDREGGTLKYEWNFGDGSAVSTQANPTHTFTSSTLKNFNVTLKVTDPEGATSTARLTVSVNNTPPVVKIISPAPNTVYTLQKQTTYNLRAEVTDTEHAASQLTYAWQVVLHHNTHTHPEPLDNRKEPQVTISPVGCDGEEYFYRINLKVTDAAGLSTSDYVDVRPDCSGGIARAVTIASPSANTVFEPGKPVNLAVTFADAKRKWSKVVYYAGNTPIAESITSPFNAVWRNAPNGTHNITAQVTDDGVHFQTSDPVNITVGTSGKIDLPNCLPGLTHYFGMDEAELDDGVKDFASGSVAHCETCPTSTQGKFHGALQFENKATVDLSDASRFNWGKNTPFTISFWMRSNKTENRNSVILGRNDNNSQMHWWIGTDPDGRAVFMLKDINHQGTHIGGKGPKLNDNNWHWITVIRDAANNKSMLYVDGVKVDETEYVYENGFEGTAPLNIAHLPVGDGYHFTGAIDELKLYNRALTEAEITNSYNGGEGAYCGATPLGVKEEHKLNRFFEAYPNPTRLGHINLWMTELKPGQEVQVRLTSITGRKIVEKKMQASKEGHLRGVVESRKISPGLYNLTLILEDGIINRKIVVLE